MHLVFQSLPLVPVGVRPLFYLAAGISLAAFLIGSMGRIALWRQGREGPMDAIGEGLGGMLKLSAVKLLSADCLLARRTFARSKARGLMLIFIMWGSAGLGFGVLASALAYLAPAGLYSRGMRLALATLMDLSGGALMLGLIIAIARRYVFRPRRWLAVPGDGLVLVLFFLVVALGFGMEAARLWAAGPAELKIWPVGGAVALALRAVLASDIQAAARWYPVLYLLHAGAAFSLLAYLPYSRLFHLFASQITTWAAGEERRRLEARLAATRDG